MVVCHCKAVTESQLREAVEGGACTRRQVARQCGAGTICGGCRPLIDQILGESAPDSDSRFQLSLAPAR
jgi:bacterioferritin-associated ferredoxin